MAFADSYPLPCQFPRGRVWAAVKYGEVQHMAYMEAPEGVEFHQYRQRTRGMLAEHGRVLTGEVRNGRFFPRLETK